MIDLKPFTFVQKAYPATDLLEQRRIGYAVLVEMGMILLFASLTVIHAVFGLHAVHYIGDLGAIACLLASLYFFSRGREVWAGSLVIWGLVGVIFVYGVLVDYFAAAHVEFLRLFVTLFSILGVYILIISIYKSFRRFLLLALVFSAMIVLHAYVIVRHNGVPMTSENWSYFCAAMMTVNVAAFVTYLTAQFNKDLMAQNKANIDKIQQHSASLNDIVERQTSELRESNERLRSFAHIASHDLKEPLRSISGFVTLIQAHLIRNYPGDNTLDEYMGFVTNGTRRMSTLITDILAFSKLGAGKKDFEYIDLNELIMEVKEQLAPMIHSHKAIIEYSHLPVVRGQSNLIHQVLLNLISNAIRFARPGVLPQISIRSVSHRDTIEIIIQDNGIGIAADQRTQIFRAYQWHNTGTHDEHAGMGLAVCLKIVEFHGGTIRVESVVGEGSAFHCIFPAVSREVADPISERPHSA